MHFSNSTNIEDSEVTHPYPVELDHFIIPKRQLESADILVSISYVFYIFVL